MDPITTGTPIVPTTPTVPSTPVVPTAEHHEGHNPHFTHFLVLSFLAVLTFGSADFRNAVSTTFSYVVSVEQVSAETGPVITSISPTSGPGGIKVEINGSGYTDTTTVLFADSSDNVTRYTATFISKNKIVFTVPLYKLVGTYGISVLTNGYVSEPPFPFVISASPSVPAVTVISPNGLENFKAGVAIPVTWAVSNLPASTTHIKADLLYNGNSILSRTEQISKGPFSLIDARPISSIPIGSLYKVRVTAEAYVPIDQLGHGYFVPYASDESNYYFTVSLPTSSGPKVSINSPVSGTLMIGATTTIYWTNNSTSTTQVLIYIEPYTASSTCGTVPCTQNFKFIASAASTGPTFGSFTWKVGYAQGNLPPGQYHIGICPQPSSNFSECSVGGVFNMVTPSMTSAVWDAISSKQWFSGW